jgi:hypothetical protein
MGKDELELERMVAFLFCQEIFLVDFHFFMYRGGTGLTGGLPKKVNDLPPGGWYSQRLFP